MRSTTFRIEVDQIVASEWSEALVEFVDANIYQTWAYGAARWGERSLSHLVLRQGDVIVAMAQLLIVRPPYLGGGIAQLRWGPVCHLKHRQLDPEVMRRMAIALREEYVKKRGMLLRVLPKAYLSTPRADMLQSAFSQFSSEPFRAGESYRTLDVDLSPSLESLRKHLRQNWRNHLNRAERNGLTVKEDDGTECFSAFIKLFDEMVARKQIEVTSDIREYLQIQQHLPPDCRMKVLICEQQGIPIAGVIGSAMGDTGIYLLGATSAQGMKAQGAYVLQWRMTQWLKQNGITHYDLGGINPDTNPGVYHFKHGLSGNDVLYMKPLVSCERIASKAFARAVHLAGGRTRNALRRLFRHRRN